MARKYGWVPDIPDMRDKYLRLVGKPFQVPRLIDLRPKAPPIIDQGDLGSCTANGIARAIEYELMREQEAGKEMSFLPSRLFIYYNERVMENDISEDAGAQIRDGIKSVNAVGACREELWPYVIEQFATQPPQSCYDNAKLHRAILYARVADNNIAQMKLCLASGYPVVFGVTVYDSFESDATAATGVVSLPNPMTESVQGGHCMLMEGYDDSKGWFIVANSWGVDWGDKGYCYVPYQYLANTNLASDFWTIKFVQ